MQREESLDVDEIDSSMVDTLDVLMILDDSDDVFHQIQEWIDNEEFMEKLKTCRYGLSYLLYLTCLFRGELFYKVFFCHGKIA